MKRNIYLFTNYFPYANSETFLETELSYLADFANVTIIPLYSANKKREVHPRTVQVASPLLTFTPHDGLKFILSGLFNLSPLLFAIPEFFRQKVGFNKNDIWNFFTSLLLFRAIYPKITIKFKKSDILYFYWADSSALLAAFIKKKQNCTIVVRFHRTDIYEEQKGGYIPFRRLLFSAIDLACPISEHGKQYLLRKYGAFAPKRIEVARLGVRGGGKNPENESGCFRLLSCSYVTPVKQVELIAETLYLIDFKIHWTHIGGGTKFKNLQKSVRHLPGNVEVDLKGELPNQEIMRLYDQVPFDLFINVSKSEGIPVAIMEALSYGVPAMATNVGGVSEIIDENTGMLLDANITSQQLAEKLKWYHALPNKDKFRQEAYNRWDNMYNADKNYKRFVKMISDLSENEAQS